jgi:hypothetical protein
MNTKKKHAPKYDTFAKVGQAIGGITSEQSYLRSRILALDEGQMSIQLRQDTADATIRQMVAVFILFFSLTYIYGIVFMPPLYRVTHG